MLSIQIMRVVYPDERLCWRRPGFKVIMSNDSSCHLNEAKDNSRSQGIRKRFISRHNLPPVVGVGFRAFAGAFPAVPCYVRLVSSVDPFSFPGAFIDGNLSREGRLSGHVRAVAGETIDG